MDINNIQALIAQGLITDVASVDPNKAYVAVGVFQPGNRQSGPAGNAYPSYAMPISEFLAAGGIYTASKGISLVGNDFQLTTNDISQFTNDVGYITSSALTGYVQGVGTIGYVPRWDLTDTLGNSIIFDDGLGKIGLNNTSPTETLDVTGTIKASKGTHILRDLVGSPTVSAYYMGVVPSATNYILAENGGNSYLNGSGSVSIAVAGSVKEQVTATYTEILQNLGIGVVPTEALHVNGNVKLSNTTNIYKIGVYDALSITQGVGGSNVIVGHGNTMNDADDGGGIVIGTFATSSSDGISIGLSAYVGLNTSDGIAIGREAHVSNGVIRGIAIGRQATSSADNTFAIGNYTLANVADTIIIGNNSLGNKPKIGIGTSNPSAWVDVIGDATTALFKLNNSNFLFADKLRVNNNGDFYSGSINAFGGFGSADFTTDHLNYKFNTSYQTYLAFTNAGGSGNKGGYGIIGSTIASADSDYRLVVLNNDAGTLGSVLKVISTAINNANDGFNYTNYCVNVLSNGVFTNTGAGTFYKVGINLDITNGDVNRAINVENGVIRVVKANQPLYATLISGDLYYDTAANILANGDFVVGMKA